MKIIFNCDMLTPGDDNMNFNWTRRDMLRLAVALPGGALFSRYSASAAPYRSKVKITAIKAIGIKIATGNCLIEGRGLCSADPHASGAAQRRDTRSHLCFGPLRGVDSELLSLGKR